MSAQFANFCCLPPLGRKLLCFLFVAVALGQTSCLAAQDEETRLLDLQPFDRITLKASHQGEVIDTLLLDFPDRKLPTPYPAAGKLELKRVSEPSVLYSVPWKAIAKVDLYEHLLLAQAVNLTAQKDFIEAYKYLEFLHNHYPKLKGLQAVTERYLKRDALGAFSSKRFDESLTILLSLYDLNPNHSGLAGAVQAVTDRLISSHLASQDFGAARTLLDSVEASFSRLQIKSIGTWRKKFQTKAEKYLVESRGHVEQGNFHKARQAIRRALAILPSLAGAKGLMDEINLRSPQVIVGVTQHGLAPSTTQLASVAATRVAKLTQPKFVELSDFGGEGGIYTCRWAELDIDDSGLHFGIRLNEQAGIHPEMVALQLMRTTDSASPFYREDTASLLQNASISNGRDLQIQWRWPHVRPETLLQLSLQNLAATDALVGVYLPVSNPSNQDVLLYDLPNATTDTSPGRAHPPSIIERIYASEEKALTDLVRGEVDVLERIAPWQLDRLRQSDGIVVGSYRLPTIHVLVPNYSKPLMRRREFRRAICYGIDRQRIVKDIILGGSNRAGFQVLSGPLPAGISSSDPLGYAYKRSIRPRPYEPRLAAVLATVARTTLAKTAKATEGADDSNPSPPPVKPLVLVHPPDALARTTCQTIKRQLDAIGISIQLTELSPYLDAQAVDHDLDYDLKYVEFPLWEPLVDLRRLLGPAGRVGSCSPAMSLALTAVDQSRNWKEARTRLQYVHEVAFFDLPVVPLWQTVNFFARRETLQGVISSPVLLYQNVANWTISFLEDGQ
ncbi:MAG: hypothetical protein GXP28_02900 [Planctomycetes bacterium]|nr:hypothetical protein [Planctomycetota bacterium]